jgi:Lrp/AsnC family transcriptional regulator, leucine-responsive regulatory protein
VERTTDDQPLVDKTDVEILKILRDDGRVSIAALADSVNVSRTNAYARIDRMREAGVIEGFAARTNSRKLGLRVSAVILVKVRQPARESLLKPLREIEGIEYCGFVSGEYDLIVIARGADVEALRDSVVWRLEAEETVVSTNTILILDEVVNRPYVLP